MRSRARTINDFGAIVGTATYSGTNTAIAAGSHGVMLVPIKITRETTPGSGDYEPITDNGLSGNSILPVFASETGQGSTESDTGGYNFSVILSTNLSSTSTATMTVLYQGGGTYSGTLTETAAGSGVFEDSTNTVVLTLSPTTQTTSDSGTAPLTATITIPSLSISSQAITLNQIGPLGFEAETVFTDVFLSGALSSTAPNTITATFQTSSNSQPYSATFTETATNSRIFQDSTAGTTITMTGYAGGTTMNVSVSTSVLTPPSFSATLTETGTGSLQFSNYQRVIGTAPNSTPSTDGQGVFYVELPGTAATDVTLQSGSNTVTVSATPVTGQPGLLRTPKLVLLESGDTFSGSGISTLQLLGGTSTSGPNSSLAIQVFGQTVATPKTVNNAFLGFCYPGIDGTTHMTQIQTEVTQHLGWTAPTFYAAMVKSQALTELPLHSLWYSFGHGLTADGVHPPLLTFQMYTDSSLPTGSAATDPDHKNKAELTPGEVATANGSNVYEFVFFNACFSADKTTGSQAQAFCDNFHAREYVGWAGDQWQVVGIYAGKNFFSASEKHTKVKDAMTAANKLLGFFSRSNLQTLADQGDSVDFSGSSSAH